MPFTIFQQSTTAFADEVMDNFYFVAQGDLLPRIGVSLAANDATNDLGSAAYRWNNLWCDGLSYNTLATDNNSLWRLITEFEATTTTTSLNVSVNGDENSEFIMEVVYNCAASIPSNYPVSLSFTSTTDEYVYERLYGQNVVFPASTPALHAARAFFSNTMILVTRNVNYTHAYGMSRVHIHAKTGLNRILQITQLHDVSFFPGAATVGTWIGGVESSTWVWNNSAQTMTNLYIYAIMATGSAIRIWQRG